MSRFTLVFGSTSALWLALGVSPSLGGGNNCAAYGPDFVSVGGTATCIRLGGRVRVEANGITGGARPASLHSEGTGDRLGNPAMGHLRLPEGALGYVEPDR